MTDTDFRSAVARAIADEMSADETVILLGEDVAFAGGVFQATRGLFDQFGPTRVIDTPISELAISGAAFGAAATGLRPIYEIMFGDFMALAMDSLINQAAKYWFLSNEQASAPLVVRSAVGGGGRFGAIHSQIPATWLMGATGLKIVAPSNASDAYWLLRDAIRDDNPVIFLEHKALYGSSTALDTEPARIGVAKVLTTGDDVTIVSAMRTVGMALEAAATLAEQGVRAEVIDLRTLRPLDTTTIVESVGRTGRLLVVEEGPATGGWAADVVSAVAISDVEARHCRIISGDDVPLPFAGGLEDAWMPSAAKVVDAALVACRQPETSASGGAR